MVQQMRFVVIAARRSHAAYRAVIVIISGSDGVGVIMDGTREHRCQRGANMNPRVGHRIEPDSTSLIPHPKIRGSEKSSVKFQTNSWRWAKNVDREPLKTHRFAVQ